MTDVEKNSDILFTIFLSALFAAVVKVVGFFKELLIASKFGLADELDAYLFLMLWVLFFVTPLAGGLSTILTPIAISYEESKQFAKIRKIVQTFLKFILFYSLIIFAFATLLISFIWSLSDTWPLIGENHILVFLLPISVFSGISIVCGGVLIANGKNRTYTTLPVFVPLCIIFFLVFMPNLSPLLALVLGTLFGFLGEALLHLFVIRGNIGPIDNKIKVDRQTKQNVKSQLPLIVVSTTIANGCILVDQMMASMAGSGGISAITFGNKISLAIISILAVMWVVLYPVFSKHIAKEDFHELKKRCLFWIQLILIVGIPSCGALALFSEDIIRLLFERGKFDSQSTTVVAPVQSFYFLHIPFYVVCVVCSRISNALHKNKLNIIFSLVTLVLNICLNLALVKPFGVTGIAMATLATYAFISIFWVYVTFRLVDGMKTP